MLSQSIYVCQGLLNQQNRALSTSKIERDLSVKQRIIARLREFVWIGGCVTAPTAWPSPPGWGRRSVHRLAKMASRCRFGGICVHCCDAIRRGSDPHKPPKSHNCSAYQRKHHTPRGRTRSACTDGSPKPADKMSPAMASKRTRRSHGGYDGHDVSDSLTSQS